MSKAPAARRKAGESEDVKRSRVGAKRVAKNPEIWRRLEEPDSSKPLTREEFAKRFLRG